MSVSYVYVQNMRGQPLMPTNPRKARLLLRDSRASVVQRCPFTIRLKYATGETCQPVELGFDPLYVEGGLSAISHGREVFSAEIKLRKDVKKRLIVRSMYRRNRRGRLWYRPARFCNRKTADGWLAPSLQHKLDSYGRLIASVKKVLPVTEVHVEVAKFDSQKMQNPEITGVEYQQGEFFGYEVREYLLEKYRRKCAYCGRKNVPLQIEHIIPKSRGGTDRVSNLCIACVDCNQKKGNMTAEEFGHPNVQKQCKKSLAALPFMNVIRSRFIEKNQYRKVYGFETKKRRIELGLKKSHVNDAFVIAGGTREERCRPYLLTQVRRNDRSLQIQKKGIGVILMTNRYSIRSGDFVEYKGVVYRSGGTASLGKYLYIRGFAKPVKWDENVKFVRYGQGLTFDTL